MPDTPDDLTTIEPGEHPMVFVLDARADLGRYTLSDGTELEVAVIAANVVAAATPHEDPSRAFIVLGKEAAQALLKDLNPIVPTMRSIDEQLPEPTTQETDTP